MRWEIPRGRRNCGIVVEAIVTEDFPSLLSLSCAALDRNWRLGLGIDMDVEERPAEGRIFVSASRSGDRSWYHVMAYSVYNHDRFNTCYFLTVLRLSDISYLCRSAGYRG